MDKMWWSTTIECTHFTCAHNSTMKSKSNRMREKKWFAYPIVIATSRQREFSRFLPQLSFRFFYWRKTPCYCIPCWTNYYAMLFNLDVWQPIFIIYQNNTDPPCIHISVHRGVVFFSFFSLFFDLFCSNHYGRGMCVYLACDRVYRFFPVCSHHYCSGIQLEC